MKAASKTISLLTVLLLLFAFAKAQRNIPLLERKISVQLSNVSLETALNIIAIQGQFTFSYNADIIDKQKKVSIDVTVKPVREALDNLFSGKLTYAAKGGHIILNKKAEEQAPSYLSVSGYVTDGTTGEKIPETSVYDKTSRMSVITNKYGYYSFKLNKKKISSDNLALFVNKANYKDTIIYLKQRGNTTINITIYPEEKPVASVDSSAIKDSIDNINQAAWLKVILNDLEMANTENISDTLHRKTQISLVPFVGSNLGLSGNTINDYSFNVLIGYSMGTKKLEVGGLINVDRGDVGKVQLGGLGNLVGGSVKGVQAGGLFNCNYRETNALQLAGLLNSNIGTTRGAQFAGLLNTNFKEVNAFQAAGLANIALDNVYGTQLAGLLNVSLKKMRGIQVSGLINYATRVEGSQLGFLNISDTCNGVPIGFLSFVNRGYHKLEISGDEVFPINASVRTGVNRFYNILTAGMQLQNTDTITWTFGYGVGTSVNLNKKWSINFDATVNQLMAGNRMENFNSLGKFSVTVDRKLGKKVSIALGPVFNTLYMKTTDADYANHFKDIAPYFFYNKTSSDSYNTTMWVGGKLALRFF